MKNLFLILALFISFSASSQITPIASKQFSIIADLRATAGTDNVIVNISGLSSMNDKNGGLYQWDAESVANDDGILVIKVANVATGRWLKKLNENTIKGSKTISSLALTTAYPITYDTPLPAVPAMVIVQATSANAAVPSWVSNVTTTGFTVNFATVPLLGTLNLSFSYLIIKQ